MKRPLSVCLIFFLALSSLAAGEKPRFCRDASRDGALPADSAHFEVDFRFSPPAWPVALSFPDEWQKPISNSDGALIYASLPGEGERSSLFTITGVSASLAGAKVGRSVHLLRDPLIPIVTTEIEDPASGAFLRRTTFSLAPGPGLRLPVHEPGWDESLAIECITSPRELPGWGSPGRPSIDAFRNIVAGFDCHIGYRIPLPKGKGCDVVLGFMESYHDAAGERVVEVLVEGGEKRTIDLIADIGRHVPAAFRFAGSDRDGDGFLHVEIRPAPASQDRYPILNTLWLFRQGEAPPVDRLVQGTAARKPLAFVDCGVPAAERKPPPGPPRGDVMLLEKGGSEIGAIRVTVYSPEPLHAEAGKRHLFRAGRRFLAASAAWERVEDAASSWSQSEKRLVFPEDVREVALYCASGHEAGAIDLAWAKAEAERAAARWQSLDLPARTIRLPDRKIEALLDASVRGLYQARTMKNGMSIFQAGIQPMKEITLEETASICEALAMLGRGGEARAVIERLLSLRRADGSFETIGGNWRETGIVLMALVRHARLTQDDTWLLERWHVFQEGVAAIRRLRDRSLENPGAPGAGLMPPGFPGSGARGPIPTGERVPEYASVLFNLGGLRAAVEAARHLGIVTPETMSWEYEYADFRDRFEQAAARDCRRLDEMTVYLPILMRQGEGWEAGPAFGQEAFCRALFRGWILKPDDPLVRGGLAFLLAHENEGLVCGTGIAADRIRIDSAACYGRALLWCGDGQKSAAVLYAMANHASPLLTWSDAEGLRPHIGAEFIGLVRSLLVMERGGEMHLLEGLPASWLRPGAVIEVRDAATEFGPFSMKLSVSDDGGDALLAIKQPPGFPADRLVVHLGEWAASEDPDSLANEDLDIRIRIPLSR